MQPVALAVSKNFAQPPILAVLFGVCPSWRNVLRGKCYQPTSTKLWECTGTIGDLSVAWLVSAGFLHVKQDRIVSACE